MKRSLLILTFLGFLGTAFAQSITPVTVTNLAQDIEETSGLIMLNGRLITHNDSGDGPFLYELDSTNGQVARTVYVENASANDWEAICLDTSHIYVADFGNNNGTRQNLRIFKIDIGDYLASDTVTADTISFDYSDQTTFSSNPFFTNYDAEALIAFGDSLYIFSKSWGAQMSFIYPVSKQPGTYSLVKTDSVMSQGLITGADYNPANGDVWLVGYGLFDQLLVRIEDFAGGDLSTATVTRFDFQPPGATQVEAISALDTNNYYVTGEGGNGNQAVLYRFSPPLPVGGIVEPDKSLRVWPNPALSTLNFCECVEWVELLDLSGTPLERSYQSLDVTGLKPGVYVLRLWDAAGQMVGTEKIRIGM